MFSRRTGQMGLAYCNNIVTDDISLFCVTETVIYVACGLAFLMVLFMHAPCVAIVYQE